MYRDKIAIEDGMLQIRKVTRSYQDYGNNKALWSKVFLVYMTVMVALFGSIIGFSLTLALANFHCEIFDVAEVYRWQERVLSIAFNLHTNIVGSHPTNSFQWEILAKW